MNSMFTGLIQAVSTLQSVEPISHGVRWTLKTPATWICGLGESIAVNGACLTVVATGEHLAFELSSETLERTAATHLKPKSLLNLERSLRADERLGGHFVLGHVDDVGTIRLIKPVGDFFEMTIQFEAQHRALLISKGSICVDGISLTINSVEDSQFKVMIIPHTWSNTHLQAAVVDQKVNLEFDVLGKYIQNFLKPNLGVA